MKDAGSTSDTAFESTDTDDLIQSVLAEAGQLLDGDPEAGLESMDASSGAPVDLDEVLDQVESLVNEAATDAAEPAEPADFDLTMVAAATPVESIDRVPDLGPDGPVVDLFAATPAASASLAEESPNPKIIFDSGESIEEALSTSMTEAFGEAPPVLDPMASTGDPFEGATPSASPPNDAARRLERLLADRLAEEYDSFEEIGREQPRVEDSRATEPTSPKMITIRGDNDPASTTRITEMPMINEFAEEPGRKPMRPPVVTESNAIEQSARVEFVEVSSLSEPSPFPDLAIEESVGHPELRVEEPELAVSAIPASEPEIESADPDPGDSEVVADDASDSSPVEAEVEDEQDTDVASFDEDRPRPAKSTSRARTLLAVTTIPYRFLPKTAHHLVTPLAISLAAWVPITWGYTILAPTPTPEANDVLRAGFNSGSEAEPVLESIPSIEPADPAM